jgi:hypothetical protein
MAESAICSDLRQNTITVPAVASVLTYRSHARARKKLGRQRFSVQRRRSVCVCVCACVPTTSSVLILCQNRITIGAMVALLLLFLFLILLASPFKSTSRLEAEDAALRQQVAITQEPLSLPHRNAALEQEGANLIDNAGALADQPLSHSVQRLQVELVRVLCRTNFVAGRCTASAIASASRKGAAVRQSRQRTDS